MSSPNPPKKYVNISHRDGEKTLLPSQGSQFMLMFMGEKKRKNEVKKKRYLYFITHIPKQINTLRTLGNAKFSSLRHSQLAYLVQMYLNTVINNTTS